jgi:S1-C subfamily serine protease
METSLVSLSNNLAEIVQRVSPQIVAVHAGRHFPSSGVLWGKDSIVTAAHTIQREEDIQVSLPDGMMKAARLVGHDAGTDLAVLKVEGLAGTTSRLQTKQEGLRAGDLALVLGRSPDSGPNASLGIISAVSGPWRTWRGGRLEQYIRLDAKLFPNSSGGAVINAAGDIIGIATTALSRIAGLVIPVSAVNRVAERLLEKGYIPRGYLGVGIQPVPIPDALRTQLSLGNQSGVLILGVEPGGPADKAGLLIGDMLVAINDTRLENAGDVQSFADSSSIGSSVTVSFIRAGVLKESTLVIGEHPGRQD